MQPATSIFLDLMRFSAACIVFIGHLTVPELNGVFLRVPWGHEAVVVFFVMSGFVISYVASNRERTLIDYAAARLGRLYSVVLPALLLTLLLDYIGRMQYPTLYGNMPDDNPILRVIINLLFIQQNWNLTVIPLSNGPFWSLGFEFWYYSIFGASVFLSGALRVFVVFLFCLCAGPRIVAFMPLWLLGALAFNILNNWKASISIRITLLLASATSFLYLLIVGNPLSPLCVLVVDTWFSGHYLSIGSLRLFIGDIPKLPQDLLLGGLVALMIISIQGNIPEGKISKAITSTIRFLAGASFTLYAFHAPLLYFFIACMKVDRFSSLGIVLTAIFVFASCIALSYIGERQVLRYRSIFLTLFARLRYFKTPARAKVVVASVMRPTAE